MFTKDDFMNYFSDIRDIEEKMEGFYSELSKIIIHTEYAELFAKLSKEECVHKQMVDDIISLICT